MTMMNEQHQKSYDNKAHVGDSCSSDDNNSNSNSNSNNNNNAINPNDVLCGRGGLTNSHVGNKRFRIVVAEYQQEYLKARKKEKKEIAIRIVARIIDSGGRFLKRNEDSIVWSEVPQKKTVEKTSQALREGLDVKNNTLRTSNTGGKWKQQLSSSVTANDATAVTTNRRKRARLVEGLVAMDSSPPKRNKTNNEVAEDVPELVQDQSSPTLTFSPMFVFSEVENVQGI